MANYVNTRIIQQYSESAMLIAFLQAWIDTPAEAKAAALAQLLQRLSIDAMQGIQLDYIGDIIGLKRPIDFEDEAIYFEGVFAYSSNGSLQVDQAKGYGFGEYVQDRTFLAMTDEDYRRFLKAKIIRNNSRRTLFDCEQVARLVAGEGASAIEGFSTGAIGVTFLGNRPANPAFLAALKLVAPVAGGIPIFYFFDNGTTVAALDGGLVLGLEGVAIEGLPQ